MGRWTTAAISVLIVGTVLLASCGTSRPRASHSSTSLAPTTTAAPTTTTIPYTGPKITSISGVSCANAMHCWAGASLGASGDEGAILASTDGGATWNVQELIPGVDGIGPINCSSETHCMAAGGRLVSQEPPLLLSTTNGGASWSMQAMSSGVFSLDAMSCLNDSDCWLVAEKPQGFDLVMATTNWGESWTVQDQSSIEVSMSVRFGISCSSTSDCVVVGSGALTTINGGSTWQKHTFPGTSPGELNVLSCPSISLCVAEEDVTSGVPANESTVIATSDDGGSTWEDVETVGGDVGVLGNLSCPTVENCVSVGSGYTLTSGSPYSGEYAFWGAVETTADGGSTWNRIEEPQASNLFGVSCVTGTTDCVAVGYSAPANAAVGGPSSTGVILKTVDDGSTWTEEPLP